MTEWTTDRTGILTHLSCARKGFWHKHYKGAGIQRTSKSIPLVFGAAYHEGMEELLGPSRDIDLAVDRASQFITDAFTAKGIDHEMATEQIEYAHDEQVAICEGLLRGWQAYKSGQFHSEYTVIEVEREGRANLGKDVTLLYRPDALVQENSTQDLFLISHKTASTFGQMTINSSRTDMQSMSELFGVEKERGVKIEGVLYLYSVKGQRKFDDYLGFKVQNTHLAYGWMKLGSTPEDAEWAWKWSYTDEDSGRNTTLGKGWKKVPIWRDYPGGVKAWIEALNSREIRPRHIDPLESIFPQSLAVERRADEIESWRRQVVAQESRIRTAVEMIGTDPDRDDLDEFFPQNTQSCFQYMSPCSMMDICFNPVVAADPLSSALYQIRIPNHPSEKVEDEE